MSEPVTLEFDGDVATLTIDRPAQLNALDTATLEALDDALDDARGDAEALVITGAGDTAFVAGADIEKMAEMDATAAEAYSRFGHDVMRAVESFPAPVIAAINGYAFGGGCELALACDFRVASERAVIGQTEIDLGVIPGWGGTQRLPRLVGDETARRLIMFGERIDASDAYDVGLIGDVVAHGELDDHVAEMARDLAAKPTVAMAAAKESLNKSREMTLDDGLDFERRTWASLFGTHDQTEGMAAFLDDREPDFE
ncbi:MAG: enoyl-CoA hydratase-related protein [Halobacteriales archaeon]|nr:enoyl-CoA hydratase-related protein [Halobacteriales archaeon]